MEELYSLVGARSDLADVLLMGTMLMARIIPIVFQTPFLGGKLVPPETRIGLSLGLTILIYPFAVAAMDGPLPTNAGALVILMFKELFIGYVIGFLATELFYAMEIAGRALDTMRGSNMAEVQVPEIQMRASPIGNLNFQLLLVVFCALDGHGHFIESIIQSFELVSIDGWPTMTAGQSHFVELVIIYTASLFGIAFALVFPGLFASFIVDVVFGMFNRIAPQLNAYFMALGIKSMAGLAMLMFALSLMVAEMSRQLEHALLFIRRIVSMMG